MKLPWGKKNKLEDGIVTNTTLDEHREVLLKRGSKFKYQVQYEKHKVIINTIVIVFLLLAGAVTLGWYSLYIAKIENNAAFLLSQVAPVPVANINGQNVRYSDYLAQYLASVNVVERQEGAIPRDEDGDRQRAGYRASAMDNAILDSYAIRLARELGIRVTRQEIQDALAERRRIGVQDVTAANFERIIRDSYGLSLSEYTRAFVELPLIRQRVSEAIDGHARGLIDELHGRLAEDGSNFEAIAQDLPEDSGIIVEQSGGAVDMLSLDGGRAMAANDQEAGQVSQPFVSRSGNGYYIVKTISKTRDGRVEYLSFFVPFTELEARVTEHRAEGRIREFIDIRGGSGNSEP
ncbi:SurA N-terminal domain-containing protein [Candidatus Saccharibacteria bacterium]|nr:SurA N-terminal domain-containing protein [Candidatus Saccharibacteria bacterium]